MSEEIYKSVFSKNLNRLMREKGISQTDIIRDLNINKSTISTWCNGSRLPRMDKVQLIADYLGVLKSDLIEDKITDVKEEPELVIINRAMKKMTPDQKKKMMNILKASFEEEFNDN